MKFGPRPSENTYIGIWPPLKPTGKCPIFSITQPRTALHCMVYRD